MDPGLFPLKFVQFRSPIWAKMQILSWLIGLRNGSYFSVGLPLNKNKIINVSQCCSSTLAQQPATLFIKRDTTIEKKNSYDNTTTVPRVVITEILT